MRAHRVHLDRGYFRAHRVHWDRVHWRVIGGSFESLQGSLGQYIRGTLSLMLTLHYNNRLWKYTSTTCKTTLTLSLILTLHYNNRLWEYTVFTAHRVHWDRVHWRVIGGSFESLQGSLGQYIRGTLSLMLTLHYNNRLWKYTSTTCKTTLTLSLTLTLHYNNRLWEYTVSYMQYNTLTHAHYPL